MRSTATIRAAVAAIEEVLAPGGIRPGRRPCRTASSNFFEQRSPVLPVEHGQDRNQPHGVMPVPCQDDFITRFGATHQFGQLSFGVGDGDPNGVCLLEALIVTVGNIRSTLRNGWQYGRVKSAGWSG
jgi:hypothetical protein